MQTAILTLNAGSSSLKFSLFAVNDEHHLQRIIYGQMEALQTQPHFIVKNNDNAIVADQSQFTDTSLLKNNPHTFALHFIEQWLRCELKEYRLIAVGHRVVHGATTYSKPTVINAKVINELEKFVSLAPLHQPYNIAGIKSLMEINPNLFQVACFDTGFHVTQPEIAQTFAIPQNLAEIPIKRYGFHGLSYAYIAQSLPKFLGENSANGKTIVAHLGQGASLCAMYNRQSIATTMGFTALDGLPMGTRCGNIDPGVLLFLSQQKNMSNDEITQLLYNKSGLLGLSGISSDVRTLLNSSEKSAKFAIDLFVYRIQREIGSLIAALNGLDNLIFTAGIGENSAVIRASICEQFKWLGMNIDQIANLQNNNRISSEESKVAVWVIPTNEELMIAQYTHQCLMQS